MEAGLGVEREKAMHEHLLCMRAALNGIKHRLKPQGVACRISSASPALVFGNDEKHLRSIVADVRNVNIICREHNMYIRLPSC